MVMRSPYMATVTIGVPQQVYYLFARANFALRYTDFRTDCSHMMTKIWQNGSGCSLPKSPLITVYPSPRIISDPWILLGLYILRRAAEECKTREIRRPKLYEALDFLGQSLDQKWLVRRYRRGLIGDRRDYREKEEQRETLRIAIRGIQQACVAFLLRRMNDLAVQYRDNKTEIDKLRGQLSIVRKAVRF